MPPDIKDLPNGLNKNKDVENGDTVTQLSGRYDHIYRRKTQCEMLRLSATVMAIEVAYSALTGFVSPILLQSGVRHEQTSLIWAISPSLGLILSPLIGSLSDRCKLSLGRRRPFIIMLAVLEVIGLLLVSNGKRIGNFIGGSSPSSVYYASTALEQQEEGFKFGNDSFPDDKLDRARDHEESFGSGDAQTTSHHAWIVSITIIGIVIADFSTDALQNPSRAYLLDVCNNDDHARGLSTCAILAGCGGFFGYLLGAIDWNGNFVGKFMGGHIRSLYSIIIALFIVCVLTAVTTFKEIPLTISKPDKSDQMITEPHLTDYLKSVIIMPYSLKILYLTNLLCWISHINFSLYFTHFVGEAIFEGSPMANIGSESQQCYEEGIRFACICMCVYSVSCICFSAVIEKLIKLFGLQFIYVSVIMADSLSLITMAAFKNKILVLSLCAVSGMMYCTIVTVPYMLVAHYHTKNVFEEDDRKNPVQLKQIRGLGTDISVTGACMCVAQCLLCIFIGPAVSLLGSASAIITTSSIFGFFAAITATRIMYLEL